MDKLNEFRNLQNSELAILRRILYKLNNQLGKHKIFRYLNSIAKKLKKSFENNPVQIQDNLEIRELSLNAAGILRAMIEKKYLIQFSSLSFAIISRVHYANEKIIELSESKNEGGLVGPLPNVNKTEVKPQAKRGPAYNDIIKDVFEINRKKTKK